MNKDWEAQQPLVGAPGSEASGSDVELASPPPEQNSPKQSSRRKVLRHLPAIAGVIFACLGSAWIGSHYSPYHSLDKECSAHTVQWSPVLRDVSISYRPQHFNGSFMHEDIYRKPGSKEVDEAWEALGVDYRPGIISKEDGLASGLTESFVQRADKYGGGFIVNVEGLHHLHCLNLLRKSLYFNYDRYKEMKHHAFQNDPYILQLHVTHCLDALRQVLMCNVDTGVLGQVWVHPKAPAAFPDFNTKHVCKNYKDVQAWAEKIQAPPTDELPEDYLAPPPGDIEEDIP
ncbi:hypothetical protein B0I35DRAFT_425026 [Stachybotrys elegans]|uniref:Tat pathway signal sequence n=1 Tax=Stachybotrys elegans TaxID=80388 RepID=A0A8K0SZL3_9HYPO|nr:hypothetical protein B0I35DRAFT_425026 [Stachybotrys elegans]